MAGARFCRCRQRTTGRDAMRSSMAQSAAVVATIVSNGFTGCFYTREVAYTQHLHVESMRALPRKANTRIREKRRKASCFSHASRSIWPYQWGSILTSMGVHDGAGKTYLHSEDTRILAVPLAVG